MSKFVTVGKKRNSPFKMAYKIYGEGEEKILFVMGVLSKGNNWSSSVEYFKQFPKYQICVFDHSGVGESSNSSLFGINGLASDTLELLDYLKWDKVNVVGITMGASVSYELSIIAPNRIKTLNLTSFCQNIEKTLFQNGIQRLLKLQLHSLQYELLKDKITSNYYIHFNKKSIQLFFDNKQSKIPPIIFKQLLNMLMEKRKIDFDFQYLFHLIQPYHLINKNHYIIFIINKTNY